jgi:hypothetical protein
VNARLVLVRVETAERESDRRHAARVGGELRRDAHRVAELPARKLGAELRTGVELARRLRDIGLDLEDVAERAVAARASGLR